MSQQINSRDILNHLGSLVHATKIDRDSITVMTQAAICLIGLSKDMGLCDKITIGIDKKNSNKVIDFLIKKQIFIKEDFDNMKYLSCKADALYDNRTYADVVYMFTFNYSNDRDNDYMMYGYHLEDPKHLAIPYNNVAEIRFKDAETLIKSFKTIVPYEFIDTEPVNEIYAKIESDAEEIHRKLVLGAKGKATSFIYMNAVKKYKVKMEVENDKEEREGEDTITN